MVLLMRNATANIHAKRGARTVIAHNVPIFITSTRSQAFRDTLATKYKVMVQWDPNFRLDDGSPNGSMIQEGDQIDNVIDASGRTHYGNSALLPLTNVEYSTGFGLDVAQAYVDPIAGQ